MTCKKLPYCLGLNSTVIWIFACHTTAIAYCDMQVLFGFEIFHNLCIITNIIVYGQMNHTKQHIYIAFMPLIGFISGVWEVSNLLVSMLLMGLSPQSNRALCHWPIWYLKVEIYGTPTCKLPSVELYSFTEAETLQWQGYQNNYCQRQMHFWVFHNGILFTKSI